MSQMTSNNVINNISSNSRKILIKFPYYGVFMSSLNRKLTQEIPTMGVSLNGLNTQLAINPEFYEELGTDEMRQGVLIHEIMHICFFHLTMRNNFSDKILFNIAADLEINQYIDELNDVTLPVDAIRLSSFNLSSLESKKGTSYYYDLLKEELEKGNPELESLYDQMKGGEVVICSHESWEEFSDLGDSERRVIEHQISKQMTDAWNNTSSESRGTIPNAFRNTIEDFISPKKSKFDWEGAVRRFTGGYAMETYTKKMKRKVNIRFPDMPGLKIKHRKNLLCAIDTSGSVNEGDYIKFVRVVDNVRKTGVNVIVCECDAYVDEEKGIYPFKNLKSVTSRRITGGGGTSFDPPIEYLNNRENHFSAIIYLTDGYAPCPVIKPKKPMMWVISKTGDSVESLRKKGFPGFIIKIPEEC